MNTPKMPEALKKAVGDATGSLALRKANLSGWFVVKGKWERMGPDVLNKVHLAKAEKQPDGTYIIRDVPIFYPNAVKGKIYSADEIRSIIKNTNNGVNAGGQMPALAKEHPHLGNKIGGVPQQSFGCGINFHEIPGKKGWASCDLVNVAPKLVEEEWKHQRWTGISAGIVNDAEGTNRRFGHIALLGAEAQALSHLPTTHVFSAASEAGIVCFSASYSGTRPMPTPNYAAMAATSRAFAAACDAAVANEPGADAKVKETFSALSEETGKAAGASHTPPPSDSQKPETDKEAELHDDDDDTDGGVELEEHPEHEDFSSLEDIVTRALSPVLKRLEGVETQQKQAGQIFSAMHGRRLREEFSAELDTAIAAGKPVDKDALLAVFSADNVSTLRGVIAGLKAVNTPAAALGGSQTFSAVNDSKSKQAPATKSGKLTLEAAQAKARDLKKTTGLDFNAQDLMDGENFAAGLGVG